jgi:hypothetical protein
MTREGVSQWQLGQEMAISEVVTTAAGQERQGELGLGLEGMDPEVVFPGGQGVAAPGGGVQPERADALQGRERVLELAELLGVKDVVVGMEHGVQ